MLWIRTLILSIFSLVIFISPTERGMAYSQNNTFITTKDCCAKKKTEKLKSKKKKCCNPCKMDCHSTLSVSPFIILNSSLTKEKARPYIEEEISVTPENRLYKSLVYNIWTPPKI